MRATRQATAPTDRDRRETAARRRVKLPALRIAALAFVAALVMSVIGEALGTLTMVDEENVGGGPGDVVVAGPSQSRRGTHVLHMAFNTGEAVAHRLKSDGTLTPTNRTPVGPEPRAITLMHDDDIAVIANSNLNEIGVYTVGDRGALHKRNQAPSGGLNPFDVASYAGNLYVVNKDSNQLNSFHVAPNGDIVTIHMSATGVGPHVVAVSRRSGLIAVGNVTDQSVDVFQADETGRPEHVTTINLEAAPRSLKWKGRTVWVVLDGVFPADDIIRSYAVTRRGEVKRGADTPAGPFVTDIEIAGNRMYVATVNTNGDGPADDRNELRVYEFTDTGLQQSAALQTPGFPPSFKQVAVGPKRLDRRTVFTTEFQAGWLRSFLYGLNP